MTLFLAIFALSLIMWRMLLRIAAIAPHALTLTACAVAAILLVYGYTSQTGETVVVSQTAVDRAYFDTYYVVSHGQHLMQIGWVFAAVALLIGTTQHFGRGRVVAALPWLFFALTAGILTPVFLPFISLTPRHYINYADWFRRTNLITTWAGILAFVAATLMILTLLVALIQALRRAKC